MTPSPAEHPRPSTARRSVSAATLALVLAPTLSLVAPSPAYADGPDLPGPPVVADAPPSPIPSVIPLPLPAPLPSELVVPWPFATPAPAPSSAPAERTPARPPAAAGRPSAGPAAVHPAAGSTVPRRPSARPAGTVAQPRPAARRGVRNDAAPAPTRLLRSAPDRGAEGSALPAAREIRAASGTWLLALATVICAGVTVTSASGWQARRTRRAVPASSS